jgi:hypothetical protein
MIREKMVQKGLGASSNFRWQLEKEHVATSESAGSLE